MLPEPLGSLYGEAVQQATDQRLKVARLRSDMRMISEKSCQLIMQSCTLIVEVDDVLARNEALLRGGYANRAVLPIREWISVAEQAAVDDGKLTDSTFIGLYKKWRHDQETADRIAEAERLVNQSEGLLNQSMERLTRRIEVVNELYSIAADPAKAVRLLEEDATAYAKQIERLESLLRHHENTSLARTAHRD